MLKKISLLVVAAFLLITVANILIGIIFWLSNINKKPLTHYVDAPYVYYVGAENSRWPNGYLIDSSVTLQKPAGEIRVLLLGGSVAAYLGSLGYSNNQLVWPATTNYYLQQELQKRFPAKTIRVLNGSHAAYVSEQEFIAFQKYLQHYHPDVVVALHGFNDVESFRVNHMVDHVEFAPSPLFYAGSWNSPLFNIVETHKKKYAVAGIFEGYYSHLAKAASLVKTQTGIKPSSSDNIKDITPEKINQYVKAHINIVQDMYDFCRAKQATFINFLQPVNFYRPNDSLFYSKDSAPVSPYLSRIYYGYEKGLTGKSFSYSLTNLDKSQLNFVDQCHPDKNGYRYLADKMIPYIIPAIDSLKQ
jgi:lysophospholipase L1-like esterase